MFRYLIKLNLSTWFLLVFLWTSWLLFFLTLGNVFYKIFVYLNFFSLFFIFLIKLFFHTQKRKFQKNKLNKYNLIILILFLLFLFYLLSFPPTLFSGRDEGSISEAAIRLSQNHQIKFSTPLSNQLYKTSSLPKKLEHCLAKNNNYLFRHLHIKNQYCYWITTTSALNFPGFYYTSDEKLVTQFPLVYTSWLAGFYTIFNLEGLALANFILSLIFIFSFLKTYRLLLKSIAYSQKNTFWNWLPLFFLLFSFPVLWFARFTLTENMTWALLWLGIWQLLKFISQKKIESFLIANLSFGLLIFTRIEGIILFFLSFIIIFLFSKKEKKKKQFYKMFLFFYAIFIFIVGIFTFIKNWAYYKNILKALFKKSSSFHFTEVSFWKFLNIYFHYGILLFILIAFIFLIIFIVQNKITKQLIIQNKILFIPVIIVAPLFYYLINPHISSNCPWCLRRLIWGVFPLSMLYSFLGLFFLERKYKNLHLGKMILLILFIVNIYTLKNIYITSLKQNWKNLSLIAPHFQSDDLILIDRLSFGNGWLMPTGPLNLIYNLQTVYFFNPNDYNVINHNNFSHIYIMTPKDKVKFWKKNLPSYNLSIYQYYKYSSLDHSKNSNSPFLKKIFIREEGIILKIK